MSEFYRKVTSYLPYWLVSLAEGAAVALVLALMLVFSGTLEADDNFAYLELGIGNNTNWTGASIPWDDGGGHGCTFEAGYQWRVERTVVVVGRWVHVSQCDVGPPFNDKVESSLDHFGLALRKEFR